MQKVANSRTTIERAHIARCWARWGAAATPERGLFWRERMGLLMRVYRISLEEALF